MFKYLEQRLNLLNKCDSLQFQTITSKYCTAVREERFCKIIPKSWDWILV